jgi:uncharacterized protein YggE
MADEQVLIRRYAENLKMLKKTTFLLIIVLFATLITACTVARAAVDPEAQLGSARTTQFESSDATRTITVVGEGEVSLEPDVATINVGAEARADTVSEAKAQVESQMAAILGALEQLNIDEKDIQTNHYSIHFEREPLPRTPDNPAPEFREEYYVSNMVRVTIRDVDMAGEVLDSVVRAGANQLQGVNYAVSDAVIWESQARTDAMSDAKGRAQELADLANIELGPVLSISEIIGGMRPPIVSMEGGMGAAGGIAVGEVRFATQIQVTFAAD